MKICGQLRCRYAKINAQRISIRLRFILAKLLESAPAKNEKVLEQENEEGSNKALSENLINTEKNKINDEEFVLLDLPKDGVHFPIGSDDVFGEKTKNFYYNETGTELLNKGFLKDSYYIGKYEVTYRLWKKVYDWTITGAGKNKGYVFNKGKKGAIGKMAGKVVVTNKHPVTNINWYDCIVWCNAYSEMCGAVPVYYKKEILGKNARKFILKNAKKEKKDCNTLVWLTAKDLQIKNKENGFRLPTWLEWQLAARLTNKKDYIVKKHGKPLQSTVNGKEWFFTKGRAISGDKYDVTNQIQGKAGEKSGRRYANFGDYMMCGLTYYHTLEIGSLLPNSLGIYDMSGNAEEWCLNYVPKHRFSDGTVILAGRVSSGGDCFVPFVCMGYAGQGSRLPVLGLRLCRTK